MINKEKLLKIAEPYKGDVITEHQNRIKNKPSQKKSQQIAFKILFRLKELGMSQDDLAEKMNVKPQLVNRWLSGQENFTLETLSKYEEVLEIKLVN